MTLVCGVDSSTQSCKAIVRRIDTGEVVRQGQARHPAGTEVDPEHWWVALQEALAAAGGLAGVEAISLAAQQHGLVALDSEGRVVRPALLWNDTRSAHAAEELIAEVGRDSFAETTGSVPVASFTITKLRWVASHEPENAARIHAVCLPHDWLTWRLLGYGPKGDSLRGPDFSALTTDRSDASGTGYFSSSQNSYVPHLLTTALGHLPELPRVLNPGDQAGTTPDGLVVGVGAGDNAAAALGLAATPGDVIVSLGTSGTVFSVSDRPAHDSSGVVAGFADASGNYLPLIATLNAARVLDTTRELLGVDFEGLEHLAVAGESASAGLVMIPYFEGERTPNLPFATASLHGLSLASFTRENLARASAEGVLCSLADGLDAITAQGVRPRRIMLIGGSAHNKAVAKSAREIFEHPVELPDPAEYVALGATVQAAWALSATRPVWPVKTHPLGDPQVNPEIRENYARYRTQVHPDAFISKKEPLA